MPHWRDKQSQNFNIFADDFGDEIETEVVVDPTTGAIGTGTGGTTIIDIDAFDTVTDGSGVSQFTSSAALSSLGFNVKGGLGIEFTASSNTVTLINPVNIITGSVRNVATYAAGTGQVIQDNNDEFRFNVNTGDSVTLCTVKDGGLRNKHMALCGGEYGSVVAGGTVYIYGNDDDTSNAPYQGGILLAAGLGTTDDGIIQFKTGVNVSKAIINAEGQLIVSSSKAQVVITGSDEGEVFGVHRNSHPNMLVVSGSVTGSSVRVSGGVEGEIFRVGSSVYPHMLTVSSSIAGGFGVGVRTASPKYELDLEGHIAGGGYQNTPSYIRFGCDNDVDDISGGILWKSAYASYTKISAKIIGICEGNYARQGLAFYTGNDSDATTDASERLRIDMDGNVGVGTTDPTTMLDLTVTNGDSTPVTILNLGRAGSTPVGGGNAIFLKTSTNTTLNRYGARIASMRRAEDNGASDLIFYLETADAAAMKEVMRITADKNVGIGTTSPLARLHVSSSVGVGGAYMSPTGSLILASTYNDPTIFRVSGSGVSYFSGSLRTPGETGYEAAALVENQVAVVCTGGIHIQQIETDNNAPLQTPVGVGLRIGSRMSNGASYFFWDIQVEHSESASTNEVDCINFLYKGTSKGVIQSDTDVNQIDFTGQHRSKISDDEENNIESDINSYIGMIVAADGNYTTDLKVDEAIPKVILSTQSNDKKVFGVISNVEDPNSNIRQYTVGSFKSIINKNEDDNRVIINSLGEGAMWVCNQNGNLENGDYITTSDIPGLGQKQNDDLLHNYTVAKITCDCDFDLNSATYQCEEFEYDGQTYKKAFIGVTYHCG